MRWDREHVRKQMKKDRMQRYASEAYTRDLAARERPEVPERSKAEMRAELERLGVSADKPIPVKSVREGDWSEWRTATREDGTVYQERHCYHPGRRTEDLYQADGTPW